MYKKNITHFYVISNRKVSAIEASTTTAWPFVRMSQALGHAAHMHQPGASTKVETRRPCNNVI